MSVQKKIQANLASDQDLKDQAQRAFMAYLKSIYLMKDKAVFDVFQLDTDSFAASLGLAVSPRVRFIEKQLKLRNEKKEKYFGPEEDVVEKKKPIMKLIADEDVSEEEDDILTVKRLNHDLSDAEDDEDEVPDFEGRSSKKVVTKTAAAKKLLKKNFKVKHKIIVLF